MWPWRPRVGVALTGDSSPTNRFPSRNGTGAKSRLSVDKSDGISHIGMGWDSYRLIGRQLEGSYFGEHTCLLGAKRVATVVAITFCELHSLSQMHLERMVQQWPELVDEITSLLDGCASDLLSWFLQLQKLASPLKCVKNLP
jgi:hypothetical protein